MIGGFDLSGFRCLVLMTEHTRNMHLSFMRTLTGTQLKKVAASAIGSQRVHEIAAILITAQ